jgi:hypothetical protein
MHIFKINIVILFFHDFYIFRTQRFILSKTVVHTVTVQYGVHADIKIKRLLHVWYKRSKFCIFMF